MLSKQQLLAGLAGAAVTIGLGAGAVTFAQTGNFIPGGNASSSPMMHAPGVGGTVTAVSGNTITVTGRDGKTYTVDAGSATITKDETVSVSSIAVGDTIMAGGTVNGTSVTASVIHDGKMPVGGAWGRHGMGMGHGRPDADDVSGTSAATAPATTQ